MKSTYSENKSEETKYSITLHCTDSTDILLREKKWMWLLERGKEVKVVVDEIDEIDEVDKIE